MITVTFTKFYLFIYKAQSHVYIAGQSKQIKEKLSEEEKEYRSYWNVNFQSTKLKMTMLLFYFTLDSQVMRHK